ncbi:gas vesicle protein [Nonomuraea thailandensis]|uniref:Gas vesicle protein n=1 Tax=Nonomuraea thailandensis TaxID=1188745 RepID=A0A9X2GY12_9ACTN|nr:hypothetical protein [Nonomuraea thailandensis]MCP2363018.1 gas vesicle protein [Nonomuraea thailandensis]
MDDNKTPTGPENDQSKLSRILVVAVRVINKFLSLAIMALVGSIIVMTLAIYAAGLDPENMPENLSDYPENLRYVGYVGVAGMLALLFGALINSLIIIASLPLNRREARRQATVDPQKQMEARIARLKSALEDSANLIEELRHELVIQDDVLRKIQADADQAKKIAELDQQQAGAVRDLVAHVTEQVQSRYARRSKREQMTYFFIGLGISIPLGLLVNFLSRS